MPQPPGVLCNNQPRPLTIHCSGFVQPCFRRVRWIVADVFSTRAYLFASVSTVCSCQSLMTQGTLPGLDKPMIASATDTDFHVPGPIQNNDRTST